MNFVTLNQRFYISLCTHYVKCLESEINLDIIAKIGIITSVSENVILLTSDPAVLPSTLVDERCQVQSPVTPVYLSVQNFPCFISEIE